MDRIFNKLFSREGKRNRLESYQTGTLLGAPVYEASIVIPDFRGKHFSFETYDHRKDSPQMRIVPIRLIIGSDTNAEAEGSQPGGDAWSLQDQRNANPVAGIFMTNKARILQHSTAIFDVGDESKTLMQREESRLFAEIIDIVSDDNPLIMIYAHGWSQAQEGMQVFLTKDPVPFGQILEGIKRQYPKEDKSIPYPLFVVSCNPAHAALSENGFRILYSKGVVGLLHESKVHVSKG
ncbi:MAG: hypothetical protein WBK28_02935 [Minisyncoccia bacterium]